MKSRGGGPVAAQVWAAVVLMAAATMVGACSGSEAPPPSSSASATKPLKAVAVAPVVASLPPFYSTVTDLGTFGDAWTVPAGISDTGDIVGTGYFFGPDGATEHPYPFRYTETGGVGALLPLIVPNADCPYCWNAYGSGINATGVIAGGSPMFTQAPGGSLAYIYGSNNAPIQAYVNGLNDAGWLTGMYVGPNGWQAYRYVPGTGLEPLDYPSGVLGSSSQAFGIDNNGRVVGQLAEYGRSGTYAFVYTDAAGMQEMDTLLPPNSGFTSLESATQVNVNYIAGVGYWIDGSVHGFRYHNDGIVDDVGPIVQLSSLDASSIAVNDRGDVVSSYTTAAGARHAFILTIEGVFHDLNEYVDPASQWTLETASGINSKFQIIGHGRHQDAASRPYKIQLPDLTPCPPASDPICQSAGVHDPATDECLYLQAPNGTSCAPNGPTCQAGVCDPNFTIVPTLVGVAVEGSVSKAIFTYTTTVPVGVTIPYGPDNELLDDQGNLIASPAQPPPTYFQPGVHGPFVVTIVGTQTTWSVQHRSVTAHANPSQSLTVIPAGDGTNQALLPGGAGKINLDSTIPADPAPGPLETPPVGAPFNGVLNGQFSVSPSGAATYTVPIAIPPGIAGMAPNLALTYSSQGGDGIAGEGWSLAGLSMISRCPRTRQQDGYARPVMLDSLTGPNPDGLTDGICLDGKKLLDGGSGSYISEQTDFSQITLDGTGEFQVVTKGGETRYYGLSTNNRVGGANTAMWLLDRVVDAWGNYFDIHYNNDVGNGFLPDQSTDFTNSGVWVSEIDYTGSLGNNDPESPSHAPAVPTFSTITFQYECRPDIHWTRMASLKIPQSQRLKSITTAQGTYSLTYTQPVTPVQGPACPVGSGPSTLAVSEIQSIGYCAGANCLDPLRFDWLDGGGGWQSKPEYTLPSSVVASGKGLKGTQFVDLNGDGRADFVLGRTNGIGGQPQLASLLNTGSGWGSPLTGPGQKFPLYLSDGSDNPTQVRFADIDGDGRTDLIIDKANVACDSNGCVSCPIGQGCPGQQPYGPAVWLNNFAVDGSGGWKFDKSYSGTSMTFGDATVMGDVDGDQKADIIQVLENVGTPATLLVQVILNTTVQGVHSWSTRDESYTVPAVLNGAVRAVDVNRDGLVDLVQDEFFQYADGSVAASELDLINLGPGHPDPQHTFRVVFHAAPDGGSPIDPSIAAPHYGDLDGDGFHDVAEFAPLTRGTNTYMAAVGFGDGSGAGYGRDSNQQKYINVLNAYAPRVCSDFLEGCATDEDYGFALADINGDGLVDLVRNHVNRINAGSQGNQGGGEILLNNGQTWISIAGTTGWQVGAGAGHVPAVVPSEATANAGSAFVDLDGDGMTDVIQEDFDTGLTAGAWTSSYRRPVIKSFPNGLAQPIGVNYVATTSGSATYKDDDTTEANTKPFPVPVNVVSTVTAEDGSGTGTQATKTYTYHSMRQDSFGRGPLGFHRVEVLDQSSNIRTVTTYFQAYPYTGMPAEVDKYQVVGSQSHLTNQTSTLYCDTTDANPTSPLGCGPVPVGQFPAGTKVFTFPSTVTDVAYLHPENDDLVNKTSIVTTFQYDGLGNSTDTLTKIAKTESGATETFQKEVQNFYETPESAREGKPTRTVTTATGGTGSKTHTSTFEYSGVNTFGGASSRLALTKTRAEPGAGWPIEVDTAYAYDQFGNNITTTSCASDFGNCAAGATNPMATGAINPSDPSDPMHHPPFRTTSVSFNPADVGAPVSYGQGRFPAKTTNALGHLERTLYDPILGRVLTKTGPNGIQTCYGYDGFGRLTNETDRCGSAAQLVTTTQYFRTLARSSFCPDPGCIPPPTGFSPPNSVIVTVTTPPTGATSWSYTDDQGKSTGTLTYAFDGGFIETSTGYNALGQVTQAAKPFHLNSLSDQVTPVSTTTVYDSFNRVFTVTDPLGVIDASNVAKSTTITNTYNGSTVRSDRVVNGQTQTRFETKNAIGKIASVSTQTEVGLSTISYLYDADGNLTFTTDPAANQVQIVYDTRGRKQSTVDPDMGTWSYTSDGFGDLVLQTDAKAQTVTMVYDRLARMVGKTDPTGTAQWLYDTAPGAGIGKLAAMVGVPHANFPGTCTLPAGITVSGGQRAVKTYQYTAFGDLQEVDECADGSSFATSYQYDALGRQSLIRYPVVSNSQLAVGYHYTTLGYLQYLTDESSDYSVLWQAKAMNALGQVTDEQVRNGVETVSTRNPITGWLLGSTATSHADHDNLIQNWSYGFDEIGNLLTRNRADNVMTVTSAETFAYNLTNRLTNSVVTTSAGYSHQEPYVYDALGNLTQKAGSVYTYGTGCQGGSTAGPHAVCTVGATTTFGYDANGNVVSGGSRSLVYNPSNKVTHVESDPATSQGNDTGSVDFMYGADGNRVVQVATSGGVTSHTVYVGLGATGRSLYEETTVGTNVQDVHFIYAGTAHGGAPFALRIVNGSGTSNRYYSVDHLGSVTAMTDDLGHVSASGTDPTVLGYDAWGARRNPDGTAANPASFNLPAGRRQFTGQEQIPDVGLVNLNGRVYDPTLGRFLSPDPNVQFVADLQSYNRYSYAGNNPLRYTDPTGYFWSQLGNFFSSTFSNPFTDIELVASVAACATSGVGCIAVGLFIAGMNATIAIASGAGYSQTILNTAIGLGVGIATGGLGQELGVSGWASLILGSASAALTTGISNALSGQSFFQYNVLGSALLTAAQGALTLGLQRLVPVSRASAEGAQTQEAWGGWGNREAYDRAVFLEEEREFLASAPPGSQPIVQDMTFDGSRLRLFEPETYSDPYMTPYRKEIGDWQAVSGREGYQDSANQGLVGKGPLPAGDYMARQSNFQSRGDTGVGDKLLGLVGRGGWPGGGRSWGDYRIWLDAMPGTDTLGRGGFTIHGGWSFGSAGCIDLAGGMNSFAVQYRLLNQDLTLRVQY